MKTPFVLTTVAALLLTTSLAWAQPGGAQGRGPGGPGGFGAGFGGAAFGSDPTFLLSLEPVQTELAIDDGQKAQLDKLSEEGRGMFAELRNLSNEERTKKFEERATENKKRVKEILLPPQQGRLLEIGLQMAMQNGGEQLVAFLIRPEIASQLQLSADQKKQLEDLVQENQKKTQELFASAQGDFQGMRDQMTKLRTEMKDKPAALLTSEQKEKLEKMQGKKFDLTAMQNGRGFGGPRSGRGGPGGGAPPAGTQPPAAGQAPAGDPAADAAPGNK